jgi:hypothetical protein
VGNIHGYFVGSGCYQGRRRLPFYRLLFAVLTCFFFAVLPFLCPKNGNIIFHI